MQKYSQYVPDWVKIKIKALTTIFSVKELFFLYKYTETVKRLESKLFLCLLQYAFKFHQFHGI